MKEFFFLVVITYIKKMKKDAIGLTVDCLRYILKSRAAC